MKKLMMISMIMFVAVAFANAQSTVRTTNDKAATMDRTAATATPIVGTTNVSTIPSVSATATSATTSSSVPTTNEVTGTVATLPATSTKACCAHKAQTKANCSAGEKAAKACESGTSETATTKPQE